MWLLCACSVNVILQHNTNQITTLWWQFIIHNIQYFIVYSIYLELLPYSNEILTKEYLHICYWGGSVVFVTNFKLIWRKAWKVFMITFLMSVHTLCRAHCLKLMKFGLSVKYLTITVETWWSRLTGTRSNPRVNGTSGKGIQ